MRVVVAGGTVAIGRHVAAALTATGHVPVVLARSTGVDLMTTDDLAERLHDADDVIDVAGTPSLATNAAVRFFGTVTANLLAAEIHTG